MNPIQNQQPQDDTEAYRDSIATVNAEGKRLWIYPKKPSGRFYNARNYVSWVLLAFLFGMPFIKINGDPILLFNILERKFILFGIHFMPQDFHLFVLAMLTFIVFIILFTVIFGRLFCGWVCPQTIFMEMVFRKIEYWIEGDANAQRRLNKAPWTTDKIVKKASKQAVFFLIAVLVSNTFLAYIIGIDEVVRIATEPVSQNLGGFIAMILFSFAFYGVFAYLREQVCVTICPYGRLQGVLLDPNSIVIAYDFVRGEPRGKIQKNRKNPVQNIKNEVQTATAQVATIETEPGIEFQQLGDCIDCHLCVQVCPTGIDIRNGTQLECVNCTACIDACDEVMDKIDRPRGLIRYDSYNGITEKRHTVFTKRTIAYSVVLGILLVVNILLLSGRNPVEALLLRTPGRLFQEVDETYISNMYNYEIINKTTEDLPVEFNLVNMEGRIRMVGNPPTAKAGEITKGILFIDLKKKELTDRKTKLELEVTSGDKVLDDVKTNFLGPMQ